MSGKNIAITASRAIVASVLVGGFVILSTPADAEVSLQGKTVALFTVTGPGGGVGNFGRPLMPYLSKYLPGKPTIIMQNMVGGGGIQAAQHLYNVTPKDGTAIGLFNPGPLSQPFLTTNKYQYDIQKFNWIGSLSTAATSCFVSGTSAIKTIDDVKVREIAISTTGAGSGGTNVANLINGLLGTKFKTIPGYNGTAETLLAVERGEVDGTCNSFSSLKASGNLANNKFRFLIQATVGKKDPEFPDVPSLIEIVSTEADRQAIALLLTPYEVQYPFLLPPDVAADVTAAYRKAFDAAVIDPGYVADTKRLQQDISPHTGAEVAALIDRMASTPTEVKERVMGLINRQ